MNGAFWHLLKRIFEFFLLCRLCLPLPTTPRSLLWGAAAAAWSSCCIGARQLQQGAASTAGHSSCSREQLLLWGTAATSRAGSSCSWEQQDLLPPPTISLRGFFIRPYSSLPPLSSITLFLPSFGSFLLDSHAAWPMCMLLGIVSPRGYLAAIRRTPQYVPPCSCPQHSIKC